MPITIDQVKELMEKATPGKWDAMHHPNPDCDVYHVVKDGSADYILDEVATIYSSSAVNNAAFIAALPDIAQLCLEQAEELEKLKAELEIHRTIAGMHIEAASQHCPACSKTGNIHIGCLLR